MRLLWDEITHAKHLEKGLVPGKDPVKEYNLEASGVLWCRTMLEEWDTGSQKTSALTIPSTSTM